LEEKSKKYSHLPVYDRQEEIKKAKEREAKMSAIMSDMDKNLGAVTDLTSSHMESKGVKMAPTPFDEESNSQDSNISVNELHKINHKKVKPESRKTAAQKSTSEPQEEKIKSDTETVRVSKQIKEETINVSKIINDNQNVVMSDNNRLNSSALLNKNAKDELPGETNSELNDSTDNYSASLGDQTKDLASKIEDITTNTSIDQEIPFADDAEEEKDYIKQAWTKNGGN